MHSHISFVYICFPLYSLFRAGFPFLFRHIHSIFSFILLLSTILFPTLSPSSRAPPLSHSHTFLILVLVDILRVRLFFPHSSYTILGVIDFVNMQICNGDCAGIRNVLSYLTHFVCYIYIRYMPWNIKREMNKCMDHRCTRIEESQL